MAEYGIVSIVIRLL